MRGLEGAGCGQWLKKTRSSLSTQGWRCVGDLVAVGRQSKMRAEMRLWAACGGVISVPSPPLCDQLDDHFKEASYSLNPQTNWIM